MSLTKCSSFIHPSERFLMNHHTCSWPVSEVPHQQTYHAGPDQSKMFLTSDPYRHTDRSQMFFTNQKCSWLISDICGQLQMSLTNPKYPWPIRYSWPSSDVLQNRSVPDYQYSWSIIHVSDQSKLLLTNLRCSWSFAYQSPMFLFNLRCFLIHLRWSLNVPKLVVPDQSQKILTNQNGSRPIPNILLHSQKLLILQLFISDVLDQS